MFDYEREKKLNGFNYIVGVDEVGRGALAGPVFTAAVMFDVNHITAAGLWVREIKDSKLLSVKKREELYNKIFNLATDVSFGFVDVKRIDEINIHEATLEAMRNAVIGLKFIVKQKNMFVAFDGKYIPEGLVHNSEAIIDGDAKVFTIAAASIVAKVERDNLMMKHAKRFPEYGWYKNKGYGTAEHIAAIKKLGLTKIHRKTFCKNFI